MPLSVIINIQILTLILSYPLQIHLLRGVAGRESELLLFLGLDDLAVCDTPAGSHLYIYTNCNCRYLIKLLIRLIKVLKDVAQLFQFGESVRLVKQRTCETKEWRDQRER